MSHTRRVNQALMTVMKEPASIAFMFSDKPRTAFTRKRKLPFETLVLLVIGMAGGSSGEELLRAFHCDPEMPTASALNQRRDLLQYNIFEYMFQQFNEECPGTAPDSEWRVIACDGTDINLPYNPKDTKTYTQSVPEQKGFSQLRLSAFYNLSDICRMAVPGNQEPYCRPEIHDKL